MSDGQMSHGQMAAVKYRGPIRIVCDARKVLEKNHNKIGYNKHNSTFYWLLS